MEIHERIKMLRMSLNLTLQEMGDILGLTNSAFAGVENGRIAAKKRLILSICREFNVSEEWLRTGEGEMFRDVSEGAIEKLQEEFSLDDGEAQVVRAFVALTREQREELLRAMKTLAAEEGSEAGGESADEKPLVALGGDGLPPPAVFS